MYRLVSWTVRRTLGGVSRLWVVAIQTDNHMPSIMWPRCVRGGRVRARRLFTTYGVVTVSVLRKVEPILSKFDGSNPVKIIHATRSATAASWTLSLLESCNVKAAVIDFA